MTQMGQCFSNLPEKQRYCILHDKEDQLLPVLPENVWYVYRLYTVRIPPYP